MHSRGILMLVFLFVLPASLYAQEKVRVYLGIPVQQSVGSLYVSADSRMYDSMVDLRNTLKGKVEFVDEIHQAQVTLVMRSSQSFSSSRETISVRGTENNFDITRSPGVSVPIRGVGVYLGVKGTDYREFMYGTSTLLWGSVPGRGGNSVGRRG